MDGSFESLPICGRVQMQGYQGLRFDAPGQGEVNGMSKENILYQNSALS